MGGILDIAIKRNPDGEWDPTAGDYHSDLGIDAVEWEKLFFDSLGAPKWEIFTEGEDVNQYYERQKTLFQKVLTNKGYPMMGRIWRIYQDVEYYPFEISQLLSECIEIQEAIDDPKAHATLDKLISACADALKTNSGLVLLSD